MKKILIVSGLMLVGFFASGQKEYMAHLDGWVVSLEDAYQESKKTGKPIMANFTGSDWCGWCRRLADSVFVKPEFHKWADENVVLLELDFPKRKQVPQDIREQNFKLKQSFQVRGYPTIWVFNLDKNSSGQYEIEALGKTGYRATVKEFTTGVDQMLTKANSAGSSNGK
jgi:thiol-disulfide isomerase/thioredoxin